jgi:hypothetical protein
MRDHGRDSRRGCPSRGIEHQQQLHQVLLHRRRQGLDDEDVSFAAAGFQLDAETIVAEPAGRRRRKTNSQVPADGSRQFPVGSAGEDNDLIHTNLFIWSSGHF